MANDARRAAPVSLVVLAVLAGCSAAPRYSGPEVFTVSNDAVAQVVRDSVAGDQWAAQIDGSPVVDCAGRATCTIGYTVRQASSTVFHKERIADDQLILPTAQMWKAMFNDPQFQSGTMTVKGPVPTAKGGNDLGVFFVLNCDRAAASKINWDRTDGHGIRKQCSYKPQTKGLPEEP